MEFWTDPGGALAESAAEILAALLTWWLAEETVFDGLHAHAERFAVLTGPVVAAIVTICLLCQVGKMILTRRGEPLVDAAAGLIRFVAATTVGVLLAVTTLAAADAATMHFLGAALPGFVDRLTEVLQLSQMGVGSQILLGAVVLVLGALQWLAMFVRQAGIFVLIAVLPIAAAGSLSGATRRWLPTVIAWLAALIFYKPVAGLIYAIGMTLIATPIPPATSAEAGPEWVAILVGIVILGLAVIALPAMMRFFSFTGTTITSSSAGGMMAGAATGAVSLAGMRSGRSMELTGPDSLPAWTTPTPSSSSPTGSPSATSTGAGNGIGNSPGAGSPAAAESSGAAPGTAPGLQNTPAPAAASGPAPGAATGTTTSMAGAGAGAAVSGVGAAAAGGAAAAQAAQSAAEATAEQMTSTTSETPASRASGSGPPAGAAQTPPGAGDTGADR
ncbi:Vancomycin B-type resistance protein VanW [Pseudonocardia sp. Ae168_Ps1]|uniref:hypothetical protein n=1 Tax=unclassified Pseudonocardia TaxID=2619320 RepID=UPI00094AA2D3|nr:MULTISPECIES: hypothetical protein [unclassified Pseudonocardia]OLL70193.1 Vancomycin B-type resistance protein VanW [Pseudonocardia sp. Ae150A_Ps1]OLL70588.1 Vancomycin B-type resistance protein VanW [Pseudonocardia sp. Ae168_Ps1]OLL70814.1 Vancomycin B-type resistance protein VanW [Pseudonocardia sp. Ae263_Ps1]OLL89373.1 Vancomycin B-type resistance protein VanW [Pseudonocardia sp. Ae356_Ps1]